VSHSGLWVGGEVMSKVELVDVVCCVVVVTSLTSVDALTTRRVV
jgi:hypothetical protein